MVREAVVGAADALRDQTKPLPSKLQPRRGSYLAEPEWDGAAAVRRRPAVHFIGVEFPDRTAEEEMLAHEETCPSFKNLRANPAS